MNSIDTVMQNQTSLQLFLYCLKKPQGVSIREAQRDLSITSSSSVHWHLNKLLELGLVEKNNNSTYRITSDGKAIKSVSLPVEEPFFIINRQLVPSLIFQLSFLVSSLLISIFFIRILPQTSIFLFILTIITEIVLLIKKLRSMSFNRTTNPK